MARAAVLWAEDGASTLLMWLKIKVSVLSGWAGKGGEGGLFVLFGMTLNPKLVSNI